MIKIFTGTDRPRAVSAAKQFLATSDYEVIDCDTLTPADLPQLFFGASFLASERHLLLRDFLANPAVAPELINFLDTPYPVAILETKLDKTTAAYKSLKGKVEILDFTTKDYSLSLKFDLYRIAKRDGKRAVALLRELESNPSETPIPVVALIASQALKDFAAHPDDKKTRKVLKELATLDLQLKTTSLDGWLLLEAFLMRLSSL